MGKEEQMKNKKLLLLPLIILLTSCSKPFDKGTYIDHTYKNETFDVQFTYPGEFQETSRESINFIEGCRISTSLTWEQALQECKSDEPSDFMWELVLSNQMDTKITGIAVKELTSASVTSQDLITGLKEKAVQGVGADDFITSPYAIKIGDLDFMAFSTIRSDENDLENETFGMTAVHVKQQKAILITIVVKTDDKQEFNQVVKIYTETKK